MSVPQRCLSLQGLRAKPRQVDAEVDSEIKMATDSDCVQMQHTEKKIQLLPLFKRSYLSLAFYSRLCQIF